MCVGSVCVSVCVCVLWPAGPDFDLWPSLQVWTQIRGLISYLSLYTPLHTSIKVLAARTHTHTHIHFGFMYSVLSQNMTLYMHIFIFSHIYVFTLHTCSYTHTNTWTLFFLIIIYLGRKHHQQGDGSEVCSDLHPMRRWRRGGGLSVGRVTNTWMGCKYRNTRTHNYWMNRWAHTHISSLTAGVHNTQRGVECCTWTHTRFCVRRGNSSTSHYQDQDVFFSLLCINFDWI